MLENKIVLNETDNIKNKIYTVRGKQVMLDRDLAELYGVETRVLNQSVRRNIKRFSEDFMLQLTRQEILNLSQFVISSKIKHSPNMFAFSEYGVVMLASILKSEKAIQINIKIIKAFVEMRKFLLENAQIFQRLDNVEKNLIEQKVEIDQKFDKVFKALEQNLTPKQGIFYDGQIFDAHKFVSDIIRKAQISIIVIDNFVDDRVLTLLNKRNKDVRAIVYTKNITNELKLDLEKHNLQYPKIEIKKIDVCHDRFLIIDEDIVYHLGSSLKDLGSRWVGFSRIDKESVNIFERLKLLEK